MEKVLIILSILLYTSYKAQLNPNNLDTAWVNSYGGKGNDIGTDLKETSDKGFIIAGTSDTYGNGNTSFYLIKTDSLGKHKWSKSIGTSFNDIANSIEIANDKGYFISGYSNNNIQKGYDGYLIKTDSLGNLLWTKNYGGDDWDFIYNSTLMPDGGLILCGESYSESKGGSDSYILRLNSIGDTIWTKKIGSTGDDALYSVEQSGKSIYAVGKIFDSTSNKTNSIIYKFDFNGNLINQAIYIPDPTRNSLYTDLFITNNGDVLLCGKNYNESSHLYVLRKLDTLNFNLIDNLTSNQNFYYRCIIEGHFNDVYAFGQNTEGAGGFSALYIRFNSSLIFLNAANFGGPQDEDPYEIIKTSNGYAFVGSTKSYGNNNGSIDKNVYLVVFNKKALVNEYFILLNEFQDNLSPVGLNKNSTNNYKLILYPNPVNSVYTIRFPDSNFNGKTVKYQLFDNKGIIVYESIIDVSQDRLILDRKGISSGIYYYKLSENNSTVSSGKIAFE
jgi:hypothetical protein